MNTTLLDVMAHRYLYYIECSPLLPDLDYDALERYARSIAPSGHRVHGVGSSLASSYTAEEIARAKELIGST